MIKNVTLLEQPYWYHVFRILLKENLSNVHKIIVFGSAARNDSHIGSDLDLYIELIENKPFKIQHTCSMDILTNFDIDTSEPIYKNIQKEGIVVYER